MAAIRAAECGADVTLIEKNKIPGRKLLLSGKGRCNLTNACELDLFLERFSNGEFLRDAFKKFFNQDLMKFFESRGLALKVERQLRVFPVSDLASSILDVLRKELQKNKVKIIYNSPVKDILVEKETPQKFPLPEGERVRPFLKEEWEGLPFRVRVRGVSLANGESITADRVILATGGMSYKFTGSRGDGFRIASKLGHNLISSRPGLVPLETEENYPESLEGLALKNIRITFSDGKRKIVSDIGELLFTGFGISGPLVLSLSGRISDWISAGKDVRATIDLKPALSYEQLEARLLREFKANSNKAVRNALKDLLPVRLIDVFLNVLKINEDTKIHQVTGAMRDNMIKLLKGFRLAIPRTRPLDEAMVTRGGVSLKEIDPRTMSSRVVKGLYLAGELIDVDADTGGFNLQAAFSTGYLAGESAALAQ